MGSWFCKQESQRIIIQGLDCSGKTTLMYRLKLGEVVTTIPTIGFNVETINVAGMSITCWDVGGRDKVRPLYRHYYANTQGVVFVIDSHDRERFDYALDEFLRYTLLEDELRETVVMVLANKQDLEDPLTAAEVQDSLVKKHTFSKNASSGPTVLVRACSVWEWDGVVEAFEEFAELLRLKSLGKAERGLLPLRVFERKEKEVCAGGKGTYKDVNLDSEKSPAIVGVKNFLKDPFVYLKSLFY